MKAINISLTLSSFPDWMISFLLPIYCTGLGFSPAQTTRMFAMHSLFLLLGKLVSGRLCDRIGRRVVFLAGLVLMSGAYLLLPSRRGRRCCTVRRCWTVRRRRCWRCRPMPCWPTAAGKIWRSTAAGNRRPPIGARCTASFSTSCCSPGWALGRAGRHSSCCARC